tara:strand:+ start:18 stop:365 length:348 start_codon:yes stop_codon:yes gene_type:complete
MTDTDLEYLNKMNQVKINWIYDNLLEIKQTVSQMYKEENTDEICIKLNKIYKFAKYVSCTKQDKNNIKQEFKEIYYLIMNRRSKESLGNILIQLYSSKSFELHKLIQHELLNSVS